MGECIQATMSHYHKMIKRDADLEACIAKSLVQARSDAISEFCAGAKILASTQVKHLPADVRAFRMESAIASLQDYP